MPNDCCREYSGLDFKFKIDDLPAVYLDRISRCMADCKRITSLVAEHKIFKKQMLHLTMWTDPLSVAWGDPSADQADKEKYKLIKSQNIAHLYNEISACADRAEHVPVTIEEMFKYHQRLFANIPQRLTIPPGEFRKSWMKVGDIVV